MKVIVVVVPDTVDISAFPPGTQVSVAAGSVTVQGAVELLASVANPDTTVPAHIHPVIGTTGQPQ